MISIVTFKWNTPGFRSVFTAQHVNDLRRAVARHTTVPHKFFCVTDDPKGLDKDITAVPLWPNPAPHYGDERRPNCFYRLKMFDPAVEKIFGPRFLWMDLDCLVVGNIDSILKDQSDLRIWRPDGEQSKCNGSLVMHKCGTRSLLWSRFNPDNVHAKHGYRFTTGDVGSDQGWIAQNLVVQDRFFEQRDGVYSFRCHVQGQPLPPDAKLVFFHGPEKAEDLVKIPWIRRALAETAESKAEPPPPPTEDSLRFVTWLWKPIRTQSKRYGPDNVNILYGMLKRHYRKPFELICVTDMPEGIDKNVRIVPIWKDLHDVEHPVDSNTVSPVCYRRLKAFSKEMRNVFGKRFVSIDLDTILIDDVTELFDRKEDFVAWHPGHKWNPYCGALFMMTAGARPQVWEKFNPGKTPAEALAKGMVGTDQAAISYLLGPGEATWTDQDGVYAFRRLGYLENRERPAKGGSRIQERLEQAEIRSRRVLSDRAKAIERRQLPKNCKIVCFNGPLKPWDQQVWANYEFVRKHYHE